MSATETIDLAAEMAIAHAIRRGSSVALSDGIAEAYRQVRRAVRVLLTTEHGSDEAIAAVATMDATLAILMALTGRTRDSLIDATIRRIRKDAGL